MSERTYTVTEEQFARMELHLDRIAELADEITKSEAAIGGVIGEIIIGDDDDQADARWQSLFGRVSALSDAQKLAEATDAR